jgi:hypothetical protein
LQVEGCGVRGDLAALGHGRHPNPEQGGVKPGQGWSSLARVAGDEPMQAGRLRYGPSRTRRRTLPKSGRIRVNQTKSDQIKPENEDDDEDEDDFLNPLK